MNEHKNKSEVARWKILRYHLLVDKAVKIDEFVNMEMRVLPFAMAWMGRDNKGHSVLYCILRSLPSILGFHCMKGNCFGLKRKREE